MRIRRASSVKGYRQEFLEIYTPQALTHYAKNQKSFESVEFLNFWIGNPINIIKHITAALVYYIFKPKYFTLPSNFTELIPYFRLGTLCCHTCLRCSIRNLDSWNRLCSGYFGSKLILAPWMVIIIQNAPRSFPLPSLLGQSSCCSPTLKAHPLRWKEIARNVSSWVIQFKHNIPCAGRGKQYLIILHTSLEVFRNQLRSEKSRINTAAEDRPVNQRA